MKRLMQMASALAVLGAGALLVGPAGAEADAPLTNKQIMEKLNKGPKSLCPVLGKELKEASPPWDEIQKQSKEVAELAEAMAKNKPSKGEAASWEKLTKAYAGDAKALEAAAEKKDKSAAVAAHGKLVMSCKACHAAHRPAKKK